MWLDDDELNPDSETDRALMMRALLEAETGRASPSSEKIATHEAKEPASAIAFGHSVHFGPPVLSCSVPWGLMLLRQVDPLHPVLTSGAVPASLEALDVHNELAVHVDWRQLSTVEAVGGGPVRLTVSHHGAIVAAAEGRGPPDPLSVRFAVSDAQPGTVFIARLSWPGGSRHLHCLAPLRAPVRLEGLTAPPAAMPPSPSSAATLPNVPSASSLLSPDRLASSLPLRYLSSRGVGIEMELLTFAPQPEVSGAFTKQEEVHAMLHRIGATAEAAELAAATAEVSETAELIRRLLARCALWTHEVDDHVMVASRRVAARVAEEVVAAEAAAAEAAAAEAATRVRDASDERSGARDAGADAATARRALIARLHHGGPGTMKSEFKSPAPAAGGALRFSDCGAAELSCFVRVLRHLGAGAPALSDTANGGCSLHVHVNVANASATAGGDTLSHLEVLNVYLAWTRFDGVTARFARPWMWREPSMAPMYATGAEFAWHEKAWEQGSSAAPDPATYDIPTFVRAVHAVGRSDGFSALDEPAKRERLFGRAAGTPATAIGRHCSLNLRRLTTYGTLEFRRFHGTLDDALIVRWAHFCVAFVECFRGGTSAQRLLDASNEDLDAIVATLADEQATATAEALMREMDGFVDPRTADTFMRDSGALP